MQRKAIERNAGREQIRARESKCKRERDREHTVEVGNVHTP